MRVLMILNNAPDYREPFLRELSRMVELTVVTRPCEPDGLTPPLDRSGYSYVELPARRLPGIVWQPGLADVVQNGTWDVICSSINMRDVGRIGLFRRSPHLHPRWVWWGHIYGSTLLPGLKALRRRLLRRAAGALVFSDAIERRVREEFGICARSFNNTQVRYADFFDPKNENATADSSMRGTEGPLRLLFVGRNQRRKRLDRLVALADRRTDIEVRLVGPGMETLEIPDRLLQSGQVTTYGRTVDDALHQHFQWADLVANPGHVGLLVMNTARYAKGIVIDSTSDHAPEYWLAREAEQPFIDFSDDGAVDRFLDDLIAVPHRDARLLEWGERLQSIAKERYTIEHMAAVHVEMFSEVAQRAERSPEE